MHSSTGTPPVTTDRPTVPVPLVIRRRVTKGEESAALLQGLQPMPAGNPKTTATVTISTELTVTSRAELPSLSAEVTSAARGVGHLGHPWPMLGRRRIAFIWPRPT